MPEPKESKAVVLSTKAFGESDLVVHLCSPFGKVKAIAKGAKKSKRRFLNALEPFTYIEALLVPSRTSGLFRMDSAIILESFPALRTSPPAFALASLACELVQLWTVEQDPQHRVFELLLWHLTQMERGSSPVLDTLFFKVRLLSIIGYGPDWGKCIRCLADQGNEGNCPVKGPCKRMGAEPGTFRTLEFISKRHISELSRLRVSDRTLKQAWEITRQLHIRHLHKVPASYKVLSKLL